MDSTATTSNNRTGWYDNYETKSIFTTASDTKATATTESFVPSELRNVANVGAEFSVLSPTTAAFQARGGGEVLNLLAQQEPRAAQTAPTSTTDMDEAFMNLRLNESELLFDDVQDNNYFMGEKSLFSSNSVLPPRLHTGNTKPETAASAGVWGEGAYTSARTGESFDSFEFLIKSLTSANNFVAMLSRDQMAVLRAIRPSLLYEFLQEVVKVRSERRMRRALPNECAFCKNNGENEECYSSHALKDWRGRVMCPVLRAFRCPRCGATGDYAHTIKYCLLNNDGISERSGGLSSRRRLPPSMFGVGNIDMARASTTPSPAPSPSPATASLSSTSRWSAFGIH